MDRSEALRKRWPPKVKPLAAVIWLLAVGFLGYYAFLGIHYWQATQETTLATDQLARLSGSLGQSLPGGEALASALKAKEEKLKALEPIFNHGETDDLVAMVDASAREAGVSLLMVTVGDPQPKVSGSLQYQTYLIMITLQGEKERLYHFLTLLQQKAPAVAVASMGLANLDTSPLFQVQLLFYSSPQPVPEKGAPKKSQEKK